MFPEAGRAAPAGSPSPEVSEGRECEGGRAGGPQTWAVLLRTLTRPSSPRLAAVLPSAPESPLAQRSGLPTPAARLSRASASLLLAPSPSPTARRWPKRRILCLGSGISGQAWGSWVPGRTPGPGTRRAAGGTGQAPWWHFPRGGIYPLSLGSLCGLGHSDPAARRSCLEVQSGLGCPRR